MQCCDVSWLFVFSLSLSFDRFIHSFFFLFHFHFGLFLSTAWLRESTNQQDTHSLATWLHISYPYNIIKYIFLFSSCVQIHFLYIFYFFCVLLLFPPFRFFLHLYCCSWLCVTSIASRPELLMCRQFTHTNTHTWTVDSIDVSEHVKSKANDNWLLVYKYIWIVVVVVIVCSCRFVGPYTGKLITTK